MKLDSRVSDSPQREKRARAKKSGPRGFFSHDRPISGGPPNSCASPGHRSDADINARARARARLHIFSRARGRGRAHVHMRVYNARNKEPRSEGRKEPLSRSHKYPATAVATVAASSPPRCQRPPHTLTAAPRRSVVARITSSR